MDTRKSQLLIVVIAVILQSCTVYKTAPINQKKAIESELPLLVKIRNQDYKVETLYREQDKLLARTTRGSKLVRAYRDRVISKDRRAVVDLSNINIDAIFEKDKKTSNMQTAVVSGIIGIVPLVAIIAALIDPPDIF